MPLCTRGIGQHRHPHHKDVCLSSALKGWTAASRHSPSHRIKQRRKWRYRTWRKRATTLSVPPTLMAVPGTCSPIQLSTNIYNAALWTRQPRRTSDELNPAYHAETLPNPKLRVSPIKEVPYIGRPRGIPLIMDNTAAPIICHAFEHG